MTETEAIGLANDLMQDRRMRGRFMSARLVRAREGPWACADDRWHVTYEKILPPHIDMDPNIAVVLINCQTQEVCFAEML